MKFVLVSHSEENDIGWDIFDSEENARERMETEYKEAMPDDWDEENEDMSYLSDNSAKLYTGDDVITWQIIPV